MVPEELTSLQRSYQKAIERAVEPLRNRYIEQLEELKKKFTQAGRLDEAVAVDKALKMAQSIDQLNSEMSDWLEGAKVFQGHRYRLFEKPVTFKEAADLCTKLGGTLVIIEEDREQEFLVRAFQKALQAVGKDAWIGLTDVAKEGEWVWINGEKATYTHWAPGEPTNSGGNEDGATLIPRGVWADGNLEKAKFAICEWESWPPRVLPGVSLEDLSGL